MEQRSDLSSLPMVPFVGRAAEMERLLAFWRGALDADEMRGLLLIGEAGIGKSRLVNELLPRVEAAGGVIVHVRLVPESATAVIPLIVQALWYSTSARPLLRGELEPTLPSTIAALRRLARLRPTLIILEDLHLLAGDALRHLALLIDALAEESLSLLATSRPVELPARASIERVLVETLHLAGLDAVAVAELWERLFSGAPRSEIVEGLITATSGNPLALRAAIRSAVGSGSITRDPVTAAWRVATDPEGFSRGLHRSVDLLSEGMAAHLSDELLRAAADVATLGEVFAPETATLLLEKRAHLLDDLLHAGIIVRASTRLSALTPEPVVHDPLAFTHTLLHQHLMSRSTPDRARLIAIIAGGGAFYSIVPFRLLASSPDLGDASTVDLVQAIERVAAISFRLDAGPDWRLAGDLLAAGWRFLRELDETIGRKEHLRLRLLSRTLAAGRRAVDGDGYAARLREMLDLTSGALPPELIRYRLRALYHLHVRCVETDRDRCAAIWDEVEDLCSRHPALLRERVYLDYLDDVARASLREPDVAMLRRVERSFERLLAVDDLPVALRQAALRGAAASFLLLFDTAEELEKRMTQLAGLPTDVTGDNAPAVMNGILLLETTGRMEEALAAARSAGERFATLGLARNAAHSALIAICCNAALGAASEIIDRDLERLISGDGYPSTASFRRNAAIYLTEIALLRGDFAWARRVQERLQPGSELYWSAGLMLMSLEDGDLASRLGAIEIEEEIRPLADLAASMLEARATDDARDAALPLLDRPLLRLEDLLNLHVTLGLLASSSSLDDDASLCAAAARALAEAIVWTLDRHLIPFARMLLVRHAALLPRAEASAAAERLRRLEERRRGEEGEGRKKTIVKMIGTVTTALPGAEPAPMRGFRMKTVLALLIGARMMKEPLTHRDFCRLAADGELDPDLARKTTNMAVIRLREAIGAESVVSGDETYELDLERVAVDLLDAWAHLESARDALRRRSLARAVPALTSAIAIINGDVPFPGLYDEFFDALRDDLEYRLRSTVMDVARALLREADVAGAEALLRRALRGLPGDEEIGELLREARESGGMRAAATVIGIDA